MKKIIFISMCFASATVFAQSKFMFGPSYTFGLSSIYGSKMSGMDMGSGTSMTEYGLKLNAGAGLKVEYFFNEKFGLTLQSGFMQRGAKFDMDAADYSPRYKLNYIDAVLGFQYRGNCLLMKKHKDFVNIGVSQHTLLNANRVNSYNAVNISSDFKMIDWGLFLGIGHNIPVFEKDILQIQLFANAGLSNIFTGTFEMNGITGKNILYGLQVSYLLGMKNKDAETK